MVLELNLVTGNHETIIHQSSLKPHLKEKPTLYLTETSVHLYNGFIVSHMFRSVSGYVKR